MPREREPARSVRLLIPVAALLCILPGCGGEPSNGPAELDLGATEAPQQPGPAVEAPPLAVTTDAPAEPGAERPPRTADAGDTPADTGARSPENLAAAAIAAFVEAFEGLVENLASQPTADAARKAWTPLREKAEASMREIARHRSRLSQEDREELRRLVLKRRPDAVRAHLPTVSRAIERLHEEDLAFAEELGAAFDLVLIALRDP